MVTCMYQGSKRIFEPTVQEGHANCFLKNANCADIDSENSVLCLIMCLLFNKIISRRMIESPIRRKHTAYPRDFLPSNAKPATHQKKFALSQDYQIDAEVIRKYTNSIDQEQRPDEQTPSAVTPHPNPQKINLTVPQLTEDAPLGHRALAKRHDIDSEILKKPRFSIKNNEEIVQGSDEALEASTSPGGIRKQLIDRQAPLPLQDPCRIELVQPANKITKIPESYIKYRTGGGFESKTWRSSEKEIMDKFQQSRTKRSMNELPVVNKHPLNQSFNAASAKEIYDSFRKRQQSTASGFGKINSFLMSLKKQDNRPLEASMGPAVPRFQPSVIQRLKEDINVLTKSKRRGQSQRKQLQHAERNSQQSEEQYQQKKAKPKKQHTKSSKIPNKQKVPEYLISYRSSLSYLKDLYFQTSAQEQYKLTVKIPKLFTEQLIYKNQEKSDLYQTARSIFTELRIPCQNLVIKRYTNCTMMIARNICLIWHFDGKRYLGGWQTQFLDEGAKHGLGLEWEPKNYVYYGEFAKNRREGLGAFKDRNNSVYVGYWKKGKKYEQQLEQPDQQDAPYQEEDQGQDPYQNQDAYYEYL